MDPAQPVSVVTPRSESLPDKQRVDPPVPVPRQPPRQPQHRLHQRPVGVRPRGQVPLRAPGFPGGSARPRDARATPSRAPAGLSLSPAAPPE